jgi:hypothetical protein
MKHLSFLLLLSVFLASCGHEIAPTHTTSVSPAKTEVSAPVIEKEVAPVVESNSWVSEQVSNKLDEKNNIILQKIESKGVEYRAYKDKIALVKNGQEEDLFNIDQAQNNKIWESVDFISSTPELTLSPDESILFFNNFKGLNNCMLSGLHIKSKNILLSDNIWCGAKLFWSPDNKKVAFIWNHLDTLSIYVAKSDELDSWKKIVEVYYPSEQDKTSYYWKSPRYC